MKSARSAGRAHVGVKAVTTESVRMDGVSAIGHRPGESVPQNSVAGASPCASRSAFAWLGSRWTCRALSRFETVHEFPKGHILTVDISPYLFVL
jgi:hypothetical protein